MLDVLKITIAEQEKTLRPSIKALRNIEDSLGISIGELGQDMASGKLSTSLIVETLYFGLEAGGNKVSRVDIEKELEDRGLDCFNEAILGFFLVGTIGEARATVVLDQLKLQEKTDSE